MKDMKEHPIWIIGCGPGAPEYMAPAAWKAIQEADVIAGAGRLLELIPDSTAERLVVDADIHQVLEGIEKRSRTKSIAVLVTGDPGIFSLAKPVIARFGRKRCRVIPGISSLQVAFARLALDWHDARIIDAHGGDPQIDPASLAGENKIAVFTGRKEACRWVARLAAGLGENYRLFLCEDLTLPEETVREIVPAELQSEPETELRRKQPFPRAIVVFVRRELFP
ncbi:MAG: putative cobalt-precorrin-6Y C(5)-methyltransferase [Syntrophaceae bacterium PtaU1.Bin231]|nr:MAG: putative cobalt-precorrin-6Y C(5)-methyltransferase [Syntrophaceae bacterium PtaU1.Bin231]